jgi:hypothetical protein
MAFWPNILNSHQLLPHTNCPRSLEFMSRLLEHTNRNKKYATIHYLIRMTSRQFWENDIPPEAPLSLPKSKKSKVKCKFLQQSISPIMDTPAHFIYYLLI